jgi:ENTS family enterobactin (siderophore) exporter
VLAGGSTKLLSEGWVLFLGGLLCILVAWTVAHRQSGFLKYDGRNPVP